MKNRLEGTEAIVRSAPGMATQSAVDRTAGMFAEKYTPQRCSYECEFFFRLSMLWYQTSRLYFVSSDAASRPEDSTGLNHTGGASDSITYVTKSVRTTIRTEPGPNPKGSVTLNRIHRDMRNAP